MRDVLSAEAVSNIKRLAVARGGRNVRLVGSSQAESPSDADRPVFLVDMDPGRSLFDLVALSEELEEALGFEVNVLTEHCLSPYLRNAILAEAVAL